MITDSFPSLNDSFHPKAILYWIAKAHSLFIEALVLLIKKSLEFYQKTHLSCSCKTHVFVKSLSMHAAYSIGKNGLVEK